MHDRVADLNLSTHLGELAQGLGKCRDPESRSGNDGSPGPTAGMGHGFLFCH